MIASSAGHESPEEDPALVITGILGAVRFAANDCSVRFGACGSGTHCPSTADYVGQGAFLARASSMRCRLRAPTLRASGMR
jgi:hypothetical protein